MTEQFGISFAASLATAVVLISRAMPRMFWLPVDCCPPNSDRSICTACGFTSALDSYSCVLRASIAYEISGTTIRKASISHFQRHKARRYARKSFCSAG
jgi:hypothetical protein